MADPKFRVLQDHYENLYAVVSGAKVFFLLPPSDAYRMSMRRYPLAQYKRDANCRLELQLKEPREVTIVPSTLGIASATSSVVKTFDHMRPHHAKTSCARSASYRRCHGVQLTWKPAGSGCLLSRAPRTRCSGMMSFRALLQPMSGLGRWSFTSSCMPRFTLAAVAAISLCPMIDAAANIGPCLWLYMHVSMHT